MPTTKQKQEALRKLGERIRAARLAKNRKQVEMANDMGKDRQCISRLELGQINPGYLYLLEICEGLSITIDELLAGLPAFNTDD
jgi:putative transcriptional regulator